MKILVADDDPISRLVVQTALRTVGHECTTVNDGAQAWKAFAAERFDVVISDWMMPGLTGTDLCRAIRAHARGQTTYFIMVTRRGDAAQVFEGMSAGADDYLVKPFDPDELVTRLIAAERVTSLHLQLHEQRTELEGVNLELNAVTRHDPITGLGNRRALLQDLELLEARVARYGHRYCMALLDVDHFKSYNDAYGHQSGDHVLEVVAAQLTDHGRAGDAIYRYGGGEFLCIFPEQNMAAGVATVERMRASLQLLAIEHASSPLGVLTMSAGVAILDASNARSASAVLAEADEALYRAKQQGRNRVEQSSSRIVVVAADPRVATSGLDQGIDESSPIYALVDERGVVEHVSDRTVGLLALQHETLVGERGLDRIDPADLEQIALAWARVLATSGARERFTMRVLDGAARWRELDLEFTNLLDNPAVAAVAVTGFDITTGSLSQITRRLEGRLLKHLPTAVVVTDDTGTIVYWNDRATTTYGHRAAEVIGRQIGELQLTADESDPIERFEAATLESGRWEGEFEARRADGSVVPVRALVERLFDDEIGFHGYVSASTDVSEHRELEAAHAYELLHDSLTGLPNRLLFGDHLTGALERATRTGLRVAVIRVGLDDFGAINDRFGPPTGDAVLRAVADLIPAAHAVGDVVARLSGDEFAVCCEGLSDLVDACGVADAIARVVSSPFGSSDDTFVVTASLGVAMSGPGSHADGLLRNAGSAMRAAKTAGKGRVEVFDDAMHEEMRAQRARAVDLERALEAGEIRAWFQPEVDLHTGALVAFEALARWVRPDGVVMPASFTALAEETGLIGRLGRSILVDACDALATWLDAAPERPVRVAVNVSLHQLVDPAFPDMVRSVIEAARVPPGRVCLELTESALEDAQVAATALRQLKQIGVELAIDDFGTGYSSLGRLHLFPVDYLKIDRSFIAGMAVRREDAVLVAAMVQLAHTLGLRTVAEGIEQDTQLEQLAALGCEVGQGYLWDHAVPATDALRLVRSTEPFRHAMGDQGLTPARPVQDPGAEVADVSVAILAHELAAPITVLAAYAELLATTDDAELRAEAMTAIDRATKQARAALGLACDVAALAGGTLALDRGVVSLETIVHDAIDLAGVRGDPNLTVAVPDVLIEADGDRLVGVISNLVINAAKHTPPGTAVVISGTVDAANVIIHVVDDGPGVPAGQAGLIFRRFGRASRDTKGSGLGLYLARAVARAHGGDLSYQPVPTGGADFALELPLGHVSSTTRNTAKLYSADADIVASVAELFAATVRAGGKVVMIAAVERARAIEAELDARGVGRDAESFVALDATETLETVLRHGVPDGARFRDAVGAVILRLAASGAAITVYAEMVGMLWERGDAASAMRLEDFWDELGREADFTLLAGYSMPEPPGAGDLDGARRRHASVTGDDR